MTKMVLLVMLAVVGCGAEPAPDVPPSGLWVDDGIPGDIAMQAFAVWKPVGIAVQFASSRETALVVISDDGLPPNGCMWAGQGSHSNSRRTGWAHMHMSCYPENPPDPSLMHTMAHEIGHALGCGHTTEPGDVMTPGNGKPPLKADDIAEYWRSH